MWKDVHEGSTLSDYDLPDQGGVIHDVRVWAEEADALRTFADRLAVGRAE